MRIWQSVCKRKEVSKMRIICVYDNHVAANIFIKNIIGQKTFGEVILKRKSIKSKFLSFVKKQLIIDEILELDYDWQVDALINRVGQIGNDNTHIVHIFSNFVIVDDESVSLLLRKLPYIEENYLYLCGEIPALFMMNDVKKYCQFLQKHADSLQNKEVYLNSNSDKKFESIETNMFLDLGIYSNFLQYISGGFDTRFFNSVKGDEFTVIKSSNDKKKIKAEYQFYHLLPDYMKMWFVMPYNYQEKADSASYEMERYHMTDLAIRWVHGAIALDEFEKLLNKTFHFIHIRKEKVVSQEEYESIEKKIFLDKLDERVAALKNHEQFYLFENYIKSGTKYADLDNIVEHYKALYRQISSIMDKKYVSVIGHGDLCFSNMLFNKEADLLKLIDPKGAMEEAQLWTNPYYDVAKLSHSICGRYDFFNNGLHHISLDTDLLFKLDIDFDNTDYKKMFKEYVEKSGFSYIAVRIYEASLFLSMLPLHMDNPQKVFGFVLNAVDILGEIETCLKK